MSRWFRSYTDKHRNPKVARLSDADFRLWDQLLCVASENDGKIPPADDLKHLLNRRLDHLSSALKRLVQGRLIEPLEGGYVPRNWDEKQYKSDTSTPRVQKFRAKGNVSGNVPVTPPDTETESDTSEANASDGKPSAVLLSDDPIKDLFDLGVLILVSSGQTDKQARSLIGKWRKTKSDADVLSGLLDCRARSISEPVEWLQKRFNGARYVSASGYEYRGDDQTVLREAEKRADWNTYWAVKGKQPQAQAGAN